MIGKQGQRGAIALEYLVVSLVTLGMAFAAIKIVKTSVRSKMDELSKTMNLLPEGQNTVDELLD